MVRPAFVEGTRIPVPCPKASFVLREYAPTHMSLDLCKPLMVQVSSAHSTEQQTESKGAGW